MRTWIFNRVKAITSLDDDHVISSGHGGSTPSGVFAVVSMGVESAWPGLPSERKPSIIPFTIWLHAGTDASMLDIDDPAVLLKNELATEDGFKVGNLSVYRVKWEETGQDAYDDHWGTNCRPVRFSMVTVH
jgi:hypothetical protein